MDHRAKLWVGGVIIMLLFVFQLPFSIAKPSEEFQQLLPLLGKPRSPYELRLYSLQHANVQGTALKITLTSIPEIPLSVQVRVADRTAQLTATEWDCGRAGCYSKGWEGTISLEGLPPRQFYHLIIEGIDDQGRVAELIHPYFYDQLPQLTLHAPSPYFTANPTLPLHITCSDDDPAGCASIEVKRGYYGDEEMLFRVEGSVLSQTLDLRPWLGEVLPLRVVATDRAGQTSNYYPDGALYLSVFVQPPTLQQVEQVPGYVMDADEQRILYIGALDPVRWEDSEGTLMLYDRTTQQHTLIHEQVSLRYPPAKLFSEGVLFTRRIPYQSYFSHLYEWKAGQASLLDKIADIPLYTEGDYVGWHQADTWDYFVRDLKAGATTLVATSELSAGSLDFDLAANGDSVFIGWLDERSRLFRHRNGSLTDLTPPETVLFLDAPKTDGTSIVYRKVYTDQRSEVVVLGPTGEFQLVPPEEDGNVWYRINNGWVLYYRMSGSPTTVEVWTVSPARVRRRVAAGPDVAFLALGPAGEVLYSNEGRIFLAYPGREQTPLDLAAAWGKSLWWDGKHFMALGNALFEVVSE